jgi:hypothetical protein
MKDLMERQAGHILMGLLLVVLSVPFHYLQVPKGDDLIPFGLGVMARSMTSRKNDSSQSEEVKNV